MFLICRPYTLWENYGRGSLSLWLFGDFWLQSHRLPTETWTREKVEIQRKKKEKKFRQRLCSRSTCTGHYCALPRFDLGLAHPSFSHAASHACASHPNNIDPCLAGRAAGEDTIPALRDWFLLIFELGTHLPVSENLHQAIEHLTYAEQYANRLTLHI